MLGGATELIDMPSITGVFPRCTGRTATNTQISRSCHHRSLGKYSEISIHSQILMTYSEQQSCILLFEQIDVNVWFQVSREKFKGLQPPLQILGKHNTSWPSSNVSCTDITEMAEQSGVDLETLLRVRQSILEIIYKILCHFHFRHQILCLSVFTS